MTNNLFDGVPDQLDEEWISILAAGAGVRIERIVSHGQASPPGFWYDQDETEWVVVLSGAAKLQFQDESEPVHLTPGDHIQISANRKHRVLWTMPDEPTLWLAVFFGTTP